MVDMPSTEEGDDYLGLEEVSRVLRCFLVIVEYVKPNASG